MPIFELQGKDGKIYEVDAPDMATAAKGFAASQGEAPGTLEKITDAASDVGGAVAHGIQQAKAGVERGVASLPGMAIDMTPLGSINKMLRMFGQDLPGVPQEAIPEGGQLSDLWAKYRGLPEPKTFTDDLLQTGGEIAAGTALGPGGALEKGLVTAGSTLGNLAGKALDDSGYGELAGTLGGGLLALLTKGRIKPKAERVDARSRSVMKTANASSEKEIMDAAADGLLPADASRNNSSLLSAVLGENPEAESASKIFTERFPARRLSEKMIDETTGGQQRNIDELKTRADDDFQKFRNKGDIERPGIFKRIEIRDKDGEVIDSKWKYPIIGEAVSKIRKVDPDLVDGIEDAEHINPDALEQIRLRLKDFGEDRFAKTLVKEVGDEDWDTAINSSSLHKRGETISKKSSKLLKDQPTEQITETAEDLTDLPLSEGLMSEIMKQQKVNRTIKAAKQSGKKPVIENKNDSPLPDIVKGITLGALMHPIMGTGYLGRAAAKSLDTVMGSSTEEVAKRITKALSDPKDPLWKKVDKGGAPKGAMSLILALQQALAQE